MAEFTREQVEAKVESGESFWDAALSYANLIGTNLTWARLGWANLTDANLTNANLDGVRLPKKFRSIRQ